MACEKCDKCPQVQASIIAYPDRNGAYQRVVCGLLCEETYTIYECPYPDEERLRDPLAKWRKMYGRHEEAV